MDQDLRVGDGAAERLRRELVARDCDAGLVAEVPDQGFALLIDDGQDRERGHLGLHAEGEGDGAGSAARAQDQDSASVHRGAAFAKGGQGP